MLTNSQFDEIKRIYDKRKRIAEDKKDERTKYVLEKIPAIEIINEQLISNSTKALTLSLLEGNSEALDNLKKNNDLLIRQKKEMMIAAGLPANYLEDVYQCPECKDTGIIKDRDGITITRCRCYAKTVIDTFYISEQRKELLANQENFDNFVPDYYSTTEIDEETGDTHYNLMMKSVTKALDFCDNFNISYSNLLIRGNTGTGKTFLSNCIARKLLDKNVSVLYMPAYTFFDITRKSCSSNEEENRAASDELDFIYTSECLVIDDLGTESITKFTNSQLFILLEKRHMNKKPTIITTNLSKMQIASMYSERVYSRLIANFEFLKMPGSDNRTRNAIGNSNY